MKYNVLLVEDGHPIANNNYKAERPNQALNRSLNKHNPKNYFQAIIVNENGTVFVYAIKQSNENYKVIPEAKDEYALPEHVVWKIFAGNKKSIEYIDMR